MTETDRELLELAAKAAGIKITGWDHQVAILDDGSFWQPLYDTLKTDCMGDALGLAVKLDMIDGCTWRAPIFGSIFDECGGDWDAATRRAIVRAAAASIGKAKERE